MHAFPSPQKQHQQDTDYESADENGSTYFPHWFIVEPNDDEKNLTKLSAFAISKAVKAQIGTVKNIKRLRRGDLLLEVAGRAQYNTVTKLSEFAGCAVKVTAHRTMNSSKGVIRHRELARCTKEEIISEMAEQGVTDAVVINIKDNGEQRRTNIVILTFGMPAPPKHVTIGYERASVSPYIPNPLRCFNCQRYGHGKNNCRNRAVCARCGAQGHNSDGCEEEMKCANCDGCHMASSKECPRWQSEKRVQQVKAERGISFPEARKIVFQANTRTSAAVVASGTTAQKKPSVRSVQIQTDLTWPSSLEAPISVPQKTQETQTESPVNSRQDSAPVRGDAPTNVRKRPASSSPGEQPGRPKTPPRRKLNRPPKKGNDPISLYNRYGRLDSTGLADDFG